MLCDALSVGLRYSMTRVELEGTAASQPVIAPLPDHCDELPPDAGVPDAAMSDAGPDAG